MAFVRATQRNLRVRILLDGVSGSGKTTGALELATGLANGGKVGVIDTQNRQSRRYADRYTFGVSDLRDFTPEHFIAEINAAIDQGIGVLIVDSASHEWEAVLAIVDGNATGWKAATPRHKAFVEALLQFPGHVIVTCKTKTAWDFKPNERGRVQPYRVGTDIEQRPKFEYDFDLWLRLDLDHTASVEKSVIPIIGQGDTLAKLSQEIGAAIREWSEGSGAKKETLPSSFSEPLPEPSAEEEELARISEEDRAAEDAEALHDPDEPFGPADVEPLEDELADKRAAAIASQPPVAAQQTAPAQQQAPVAVETDTKPVQCDVCGTKIYPNVIEEVNGARVKGSVLINRTRERFGRPLCIEHWQVEQRKRKARGE